MSLKKIILAECKKKIIPYFEEHGFEQCEPRLRKIEGLSTRQVPLTGLQRTSVQGSIQLIEFHFDKHGDPSFQIKFAALNREGVSTRHGFIEESEASVYGDGHYGICQTRRTFILQNFLTEFRIRFWQKKSPKNAKKLVLQAFKNSHQIIEWFDIGIVGNTLVTRENLPQGAEISRGDSRKFLLREVCASSSGPIGKSRVFFTRKDVEKFATETLAEQGRTVNFRYYWPWEKIRSF